ncbi:hypothetical protein [uncultured Enterovirga sp.]|uniref:hypothetical protein n=1 Tax=uncultured Enterovirga sp. TaxID=2026352 RepID=UPI0035CB628C
MSRPGGHLTTRQYGRLLDDWVPLIGLDPAVYGAACCCASRPGSSLEEQAPERRLYEATWREFRRNGARGRRHAPADGVVVERMVAMDRMAGDDTGMFDAMVERLRRSCPW